nr:MAG TPA: nucleoid-associated protein [Caudoviricetes sp.]
MKIWKMIADYFDVTVDYLIEDGDIKKENPTGVPDEVYKVAKEFMELPPDAQAEARSYLAFLRQRYTRQDG